MMEPRIWLIAGLGNPGHPYENNWHNSGFKVLDILSRRHNISVSRRRSRGLVGQGQIASQKCLLLKPTTYMNLSGEAVRAALAYYKISPEACLVIYADIDIPVGQIRIRESGGAGTHNGMRSVTGSLGREDFPRVRIGIGPQPEYLDIAAYVLTDVPADCLDLYGQSLDKAADAVETILGEGLARAMNLFNRK
jgi:PTH1 family peptidyl-tRNA hydrolase